MMHWYLVRRSDGRGRALADRHYSRQNPGYREFCPPGNNIVLIVPDNSGATALWVSHRPSPGANLEKPRMDGFDCWDNPYFRNESDLKSSELIVEALAVTCHLWTDALPGDGFHSFVDPRKVKGVKVRGQLMYGFCFMKAGFQLYPQLTTDKRLLRWIMPLERLLNIEPQAPNREQIRLFA